MELRDTSQLRIYLERQAPAAGIALGDDDVQAFEAFYEMVLRWNRRLNLTRLTSPEEFASRHVIEPVYASRFLLKSIGTVWDMGSGLGVPGVPLAIVRPDLNVRLVESRLKRAVFLKEVAAELGLKNVEVANRRFQQLDSPGETVCLAARAIEGMSELLPELLLLGRGAGQVLLFAGEPLLERVKVAEGWVAESHRLPGSRARYLVDMRQLNVPRGT